MRCKTAIETDIKFYEDEKGSRKITIGSEDQKYCEKVEHSVQLKLARDHQFKKEKQRCQKQFETIGKDHLVSRTRSDFELKDIRPTVANISPTSHMNSLKLSKIPLSSPRMLATADRIEMSSRTRTLFMAAVIKDGGGNLDDYVLSQSSTVRSSKSVRTNMASNIKRNFEPPRTLKL